MSDVTREMVRDTEREIFEDAIGQDPGYDLSDDDVDEMDLSEVEGWDGEPLHPDEIAVTNSIGWDENNNDRPIALHDEQARHEQFSKVNNEVLEAMGRASAERDRQAYERQREELALGVINAPEQTIDHVAMQNQRIAELTALNVNGRCSVLMKSMEQDFEKAYDELTAWTTKPGG